MPPHLRADWEAFKRQAERVERARQALLGCLPVGRVDPVPVPVGLERVDDVLSAGAAELDAWKRAEVADAWQRCAEAIEAALAAIPDARAVAEGTTELEELLGAVSDVVEPLTVWADAERAWLSLRTRA
jgi:hypothetical protein